MEELKLEQEWDKVFPKNENVNHKKVTFINHFGITTEIKHIHTILEKMLMKI